MASKTIQAAGGIVVRQGARPLIAIVQRSKDDRWVLPRGKLKRDENPVSGAQREVVEETGHRVRVNEFIGAITYRARGRPKVVQFWHMHAEEEASYELMADIMAVEWLSLKAAIRRLSYPLEKLFLRNVGRRALARRQPSVRRKARKSARKKTGKKAGRKSSHKTTRNAARKPNKPGVKSNKPGKTKKRAPAAGRGGKSHPARSKSRRAKLQTGKSHAANSAAVRKSAAQRLAAVQLSAPERAPPPVAAKPVSAAERKTILQRMLGRLAG